MVLCKVPFDGGQPLSGRKRVKIHTAPTASFSSTIAEECIVLLRKLHPLPAWNDIVNEFIGSALQNIPQLVFPAQFVSRDDSIEEMSSAHKEQVC